MTLEPLLDKLIIEPTLAPEKTKAGVYLPDSARNRAGVGVVVSMGTGGWDKKRERPIPMPDVKPGDTVVYRTWAGSELCPRFSQTGKPYLVVEPADVLAKIVEG